MTDAGLMLLELVTMCTFVLGLGVGVFILDMFCEGAIMYPIGVRT